MTKKSPKLTYGWFEVGYNEGFAGVQERPPEGSFSRRGMYRTGYDEGRIARSLGKSSDVAEAFKRLFP